MERTWETPLVTLVPNPKIDGTWAVWSVSLLVLNVGNGGMIAISHAIILYHQSSHPFPSIPIQSLPVPSSPFQSHPVPSSPIQSLPLPSSPFQSHPVHTRKCSDQLRWRSLFRSSGPSCTWTPCSPSWIVPRWGRWGRWGRAQGFHPGNLP